MKQRLCAYCGNPVSKHEREHVVPACLYPKSKDSGKIQRLTVPACSECNRGWCDDEAHFRTMMLVSGQPNEAVKKLWYLKALPSFDKIDGRRRLRDVTGQLKAVLTQRGNQYMIYPGRDERVLRILRKIIRGLCHHHGIMSAVPDAQVSAGVATFAVPPAFLNEMTYEHKDKHIFEYRYAVMDSGEIGSFWILTFYQRTTFYGVVLTGIEENKQRCGRCLTPNGARK